MSVFNQFQFSLRMYVPILFSRWDNFLTFRVRRLKLFVGPYYENLILIWADGNILTTPTALPLPPKQSRWDNFYYFRPILMKFCMKTIFEEIHLKKEHMLSHPNQPPHPPRNHSNNNFCPILMKLGGKVKYMFSNSTWACRMAGGTFSPPQPPCPPSNHPYNKLWQICSDLDETWWEGQI